MELVKINKLARLKPLQQDKHFLIRTLSDGFLKKMSFCKTYYAQF